MKQRKKFIWRLFFSYIFITIGALAAAGWYFVHSLDAFLHDLVVVELFERARLVQNQILPHLAPPDPPAVDAVCKKAGSPSSCPPGRSSATPGKPPRTWTTTPAGPKSPTP
jgi:hypothetical protein